MNDQRERTRPSLTTTRCRTQPPRTHRRATPLQRAATVASVLLLVAPALAESYPRVIEPVGREAEIRSAVAWQVALENVGFSPGLIDGKIGPKTQLATREFQRVRGLPTTGQLDEKTAAALKVDPDRVLGRYTITADDLAEIGPNPKSWLAKSKLDRIGHEALINVVGERFKCAINLLETLNPGRNINAMKAGDQVIVPVTAELGATPKGAKLEVNLSEKVIRVIGPENRLLALFHCSIAANRSKRPSGSARVTVIAENPTYKYDPRMWPEVKEKVPGPIFIPPGPRNPVGRCWIGLSLPGYGMHGTPNPELIGKTGSHGCFRLTNWDAKRLAKMIEVGTPVKFTDNSDVQVASSSR